MLFRVRLLGHVKLLALPTCLIQCRINRWDISLAFDHAMEVCLSRQLRSGVPPFMPYNARLLSVIVGVFKALLARNCNINSGIVHKPKVLCTPSLSSLTFSSSLSRFCTNKAIT